MSNPNFNLEKNLKNNCHHNEELNKSIMADKSYYYCYKCNNIILIDHEKFYCTYKLIEEDRTENEKVEFDPVVTLHNMIQRQEEQIKDINEKLVLNFSYNEESEEKQTNILKNINNENNNFTPPPRNKKKRKISKLLFDEEIFEKYAKIRNRVLIYIHNLCSKMKYNDSSFYFSLYLLDTYLSRIMSDEITDRELFLVVLGFFLISSKYIEDDIFEPELQIFCNFEKSILLSIEEIRAAEVQCLTLINYNMYIYSVYDWVNILLSNGVVFEDEINDIDEVDNIYAYTQKLLTNITSKIFFCKYSSIQIAFSIIHISREKYLNKNISLSNKLYNLLLDIYNISFSDYEECYNLIKNDSNEEYDISEGEEESYNIDANIKSKKRAKSLEVNLTESNYSTAKAKRDISKIMNNISKNKNMLSQSSNKYINTDFNIKNNSNVKKTKLYISRGQLNLAVHKLKYKSSKSSDKNYEFQNNNLMRNFNNYNLNKKLKGNNNTLKSFKNSELNLQDAKQIMIEYQKIVNSKSKKKNQNSGHSNTLFINYAPKFLIKNTGPNINNVNYINNININNEFINLINKKEKGKDKDKKIHKNTKSGLNFNYVNNINNSRESKNKYKLKKSIFNRGNSINSLNYEYVIDNIKNLNINKKVKNINTSQNIVQIKNTNSKNKRIDKTQKEKYKTHLILDMPENNTETSHKIILNTEHNNKSSNKYNNINNNHNKNRLKINLGEKNNIKILNQNLNKNKLNSRKFIINFKDVVNKKVNIERKNNFISKEKGNDSKKYKSLNKNEYQINPNNNKSKNILQNKNYKNNIIYGNINDNNLFQKILKESNNLNFKNVALIKSKLPKLKVNKTGLNNN